jgi:hypothetical protein
MPGANRHFLPGYVWHITHQCSSQFQSFNRCAPFKTVKASARSRIQGSRRFDRFVTFQSIHCFAGFQVVSFAEIEEALEGELAVRDTSWSETIAVGSMSFVEKVKKMDTGQIFCC